MKLLTATRVAVVVSILASTSYGQAIPYTNYLVDLRSHLPATDAIVGLGSYSETPWVWHSGANHPPAPFWNDNAMLVEEVKFTAPPELDPATFIAKIPYAGTLTLNAHEEANPEEVVGTMVWSLTGTATIDLNAAHAIVDEDTGLIMFKGAQSLLPEGEPVATYTFVEETGVFLDDGILPVAAPDNPYAPNDSIQLHAGRLFVPLLARVDVDDPVQLQQNILTAPMIGGFGEGVWAGHFTYNGPLQAGDADQDFDFDQFDLIQVQQAAKYLTDQPATWGEGDWNGAPAGAGGDPPAGDGLFNQDDIIAALNSSTYLKGPFAALAGPGKGDGKASITYDPTNGELGVDVGATELTSINIDSAATIFTGKPAQNLGGSFDNDADGNIFKATFGNSFGSLSFGNVAQAGLTEEFVLGDLTVVGSLQGGGDLGDVDLIYVPEPASALLLALGLAIGLLRFGRIDR